MENLKHTIVNQLKSMYGDNSHKLIRQSTWKATTSLSQLEGDNKRSVGLGHSQRLQVRSSIRTSPVENAHSSHIQSRSPPVDPTRINRFDKQGGDLGGIRPSDRFLFKPVLGPQERRGLETSKKFESTK